MEEWLLNIVMLPDMKKIHFWDVGFKIAQPSKTQDEPHIHILSCVFHHLTAFGIN